VLILRWYWWRVNAWSELAATLAPIALTILALILGAFGINVPGLQSAFPTNLFAVVTFTTIIWIAATYLTAPTDQATLDHFYKRVRPGGPGWKPFAARHTDIQPDTSLGNLVLDWIAGVVLVYATLFGVGQLLFGETLMGSINILLALSAAAFLAWDLRRRETTAPAA